MNVLVWNGQAWVAHRLGARPFWLKIVRAGRDAPGRPSLRVARRPSDRVHPLPLTPQAV